MFTIVGFPTQVPEVGITEYTAVPATLPIVVNVCAIVLVIPLDAPITPDWTTVHVYDVDGIELVKTFDVIPPEQIVCVAGVAVAIGAGPITTEAVAVTAAHPPLATIVFVNV